MPFKRARVLRAEFKGKKLAKNQMFQCPLSGQGYCRLVASGIPGKATMFQCPLSGQGYCRENAMTEMDYKKLCFNAL